MNADYYERNAEQYAAATASADLSALYAPFLARVRPGGRARLQSMLVNAAGPFWPGRGPRRSEPRQHAAAASADLSALYAPFLARVRPGGRILDVGCGAGRDLAAFCARGYAAEGIEPSPRLAAIARSRSGAPVRVMAVQELDVAGRYDGIWACASLLHVPRSALLEALARVAHALAPGGALWFSVKEGQGEAIEVGPAGGARTIVHYDETELLCAVGAVAGLALEALARSVEARPAGPVSWINVLALCKADPDQEALVDQRLRVATRAIILRDGLVALAAFDDESGYHYNLPGGGLEPGESLHDGLRREVREELGCDITVGPLLLVYENLPAAGLHVPPYAIHGVGLFFLCELAPGSEPHLPASPDPNQVDVCWVPLAQLGRAPLLPQVGAQIERALAERALAERAASELQDPHVIEDVHTFPPRLPNWQPLPPFVISTEAECGAPLAGLTNCRQIHPGLFTGGMPTGRWLQAAAQAGFEAIINLATEAGGPYLQDEAAICARLGLGYIHLPVDWRAPSVADYIAFERALDQLGERRVLVHCRHNYRASAFVYLHRVRRGEEEAQARADLLSVWMPDETWQTLIDAVLAL